MIPRGGGGGDQERATFEMARFDTEKIRHPVRNTTAKPEIPLHQKALGQDSQTAGDGGCYFLWAFGCLWFFLGGFWMADVSSPGPLGACYWAQWERACQGRQKRHLEKWPRAFKSRGTIWHTPVAPNFAIPNLDRSQPPPPPPPACAQATGAEKGVQEGAGGCGPLRIPPPQQRRPMDRGWVGAHDHVKWLFAPPRLHLTSELLL